MVNNFVSEFWKLMKGGPDTEELRASEREYFASLCADIRAQKDRVGGHWAVASVVRTREERDIMKECLGQDLTIVCLEMSNEERRKRILGRHGGKSEATEMVDVSYYCSEGRHSQTFYRLLKKPANPFRKTRNMSSL